MAKKTGGNARSIPDGKTQVNFNLPASTFEKMKAIAITHGNSQTEVFNMAVDKFIELYEKKNGPVQVGAKKKEIKL